MAAYDRNRNLFVCLVIVFLIEIVSTLIIVGRHNLEGMSDYIHDLECVLTKTHRYCTIF